MAKRIRVTTELGNDDVLCREIKGKENLSALFTYYVELLSPDPAVELEKLLASPLALHIEGTGYQRHIHGIVTEAEYLGRETLTSRYYIYRLTIQPLLWYLTQTRDSRIYQEKSAVDIIKAVLNKYPFEVEWRLLEDYRQWQYCVQYEESDFDFISRLMEKEGIYYWFEHTQDKHLLVIADYMQAHRPLESTERVKYYAPDRLVNPQEDSIYQWLAQTQISASQVSCNDFDFTRPLASLRAYSALSQQTECRLEQYQPLGNYVEYEEGEYYAKISLQSLSVPRRISSGRSNHANLACGYTFTLQNYPDTAQNKTYLLTEFELHIQESSGASEGGLTAQEQLIDVQFKALDITSLYRAPQSTPTPKASGPHTAIVVGPEGEEIWTDDYGRIKVQFHWDRLGQNNENSSCWVRVSSPWAGSGFGGVQIPRVKDEVIINFIGGFYDRPMVVGRVYNASNMPAINLPEEATKSGVQTRTKEGNPNNANSMMFEDKKGQEQMSFGAERDLDVLVKQNEQIDIQGSQAGWHGGATAMAVVGTDDNIFKDASTEDNLGDAIRTVKGASNEFVTGPRTHKIQGNSNIIMQRGYVKTVQSGLADYSYNSGLIRFILGDQTHQAKSDVTRSVSADETSQVVTSGYYQSVVGGPLKQSAQRIQNTTTGSDAYVLAQTKVLLQSVGNMCFRNPATVTCQTKNFSIKNEFEFDLGLFKSLVSNEHQSSTPALNIGLIGDSSSMGVASISNTGMKFGMTVGNISAYAMRFNLTGADFTIVNGLKEKVLSNMHINGLKLNF